MSASLRVLIGVVIAALVVDATLAYRNINALLSQERTIAGSYIRLNALERAMTLVTEAETGQRGFLITGNEEYLAPYDEARKAIETDLRRLHGMWPDSSEDDLNLLEQLVAAKLVEMQRTIALRREGRLTAADTIVRRGRGKEQMDRIRGVVDKMRTEEQERLNAATSNSAEARRTAFATAAFASGIALSAVLVCLVLLRRDLAQRSRLAEERAALLRREQEARSQAESANRLKDDFLATLSHELRNPLHAVVGWLQILRQTDDETMRGRAVDTVERNTRALQRMIEDLLDASRASRGKLELNLAPTSVGALVVSVLETMRPSAATKRVELAGHATATDAAVHGDYDRLAQVVINLVSNAIKFTPAGGRVDVSLTREGETIVIAVKDTGRGISRDALSQIFEPFRQTGPQMHGSDGGLGLGLSIANHIVELHGGTITATSEGAGKGSTFIVRLPGARVGAEARQEPVAHDARS